MYNLLTGFQKHEKTNAPLQPLLSVKSFPPNYIKCLIYKYPHNKSLRLSLGFDLTLYRRSRNKFSKKDHY